MQFKGTGKGRFVEGQPFDIPDGDTVTIEKIIKEGVGEPVDLVGQTGPPNPQRREVEVADADLRGDPLTHPQDRALADSMSEEKERDIDATHDESAKQATGAKAKAAAKENPAEEGGVEAAASRAKSSAKSKD
jgi:hypothetical protein